MVWVERLVSSPWRPVVGTMEQDQEDRRNCLNHVTTSRNKAVTRILVGGDCSPKSMLQSGPSHHERTKALGGRCLSRRVCSWHQWDKPEVLSVFSILLPQSKSVRFTNYLSWARQRLATFSHTGWPKKKKMEERILPGSLHPHLLCLCS